MLSESDEFYYPQDLVRGTKEWDNATYKPIKEESDLRQFIENQVNLNTQKKTVSDMKIWEQFCLSRGENRSMAEIPIKELDCLLRVFFNEIVKKSEEPYEPDSLTSFHQSFNRHLSQNGAQFNIITDKDDDDSDSD